MGEKRDFQEKLKGHGLLGEIQPLCVACSDDGPASRKTRSFMAIGQVPASRCFFFMCVCVRLCARKEGGSLSSKNEDNRSLTENFSSGGFDSKLSS